MAAITTISAVVAAVAAVASVGLQYQAGREQKKAANAAQAERDKARREAKEANDISQASERAKIIAEQRRAVRESKVRRAKILQSAQNTGVGDSSGAQSSSGIIGTNLADTFSQSSAYSNAAAGITAANQRASDYLGSAENIMVSGNNKANSYNTFAGVATAVGSFAGSGAFEGLSNWFSGSSTPKSDPTVFNPRTSPMSDFNIGMLY